MQIGRKKISMNNKILKQNAIMILYITNVIDELDKKIKHIEQECSYRSKYIDIRVNKELKKYFEKCLELEEVLNVGIEKD